MAPRSSLAIATGVSVLLLASGTAFAVANVFGSHRPDRVGTFEPIEQPLIPAVTTTKPPTAALHTTTATPGDGDSDQSETTPPRSTPAVSPAPSISSQGTMPDAATSAPGSASTTTTTDRDHDREGRDDHDHLGDD